MKSKAQKKYGSIFESITGKPVPSSVQEAWDIICEVKNIKKDSISEAGSNLTPTRGNVFGIKDFSIDIDKHLKH